MSISELNFTIASIYGDDTFEDSDAPRVSALPDVCRVRPVSFVPTVWVRLLPGCLLRSGASAKGAHVPVHDGVPEHSWGQA